METTSSSSGRATSTTASRRSVMGLLGAVPVAAGMAGAFTLGGAGPAVAAPDGHGVPPQLRPGGELDQYLADLAASDVFSGTVLLSHHGRQVLSRSYGMANSDLSHPNGPDTIFSVGSITKLFTTIGICQLAERGDVSFEQPVGAYVDGFPEEIANTVTVHQLLTHTSGMGDYHTSDAYRASGAWDFGEAEAMDAVLEVIRHEPLGFTPGSSHSYSNSAFVVLGAVVAAVSGLPYHDYVRLHVFDAAGMSSADFYTRDQWRDDGRIARPYGTAEAGGRVDVLDTHYPFVGLPAGNSHASCQDLVNFARALAAGELLGPAYVHLALAPMVPVPIGSSAGVQLAFGSYGALSLLANDRWMLSRNGGAPGTSAELLLQPPGSAWTLAVLTNYDEAARPVARRALDLITAHG